MRRQRSARRRGYRECAPERPVVRGARLRRVERALKGQGRGRGVGVGRDPVKERALALLDERLVVVRAAPSGTGIIAGGPMRAVFETLGIQDVVAKSTGSQNPHNMVKATINALENLMSPRSVAAKRGKKVSDIVGRRDGAQAKE